MDLFSLSVKILWTDLETTGRNHRHHGATEIAAIAEIDGEIRDEIDIRVCPWPGAEIEQEALEVTGKTEGELLLYAPEQQAFQKLYEFLEQFIDPYDSNDKFWFGAFNQTFDVDFLSRFWERNESEKQWIGSYINRRPNLDPRVLATTLVFKGEMDEPENFKLSTLCEHSGLEISNDETHSGLYDARKCRELFYELVARF